MKVKNNFISVPSSLFEKPTEKIESQTANIQLTSVKTYSEFDPIEMLSLKPSIEQILKEKNIHTVGKFYYYKRKRLRKIKHLGPKSVSYLMKVKRTIRIARKEYDDNHKLDFGQIYVPDKVSRNDSIGVLKLPTRIENSLRNYGIFYIGEFCDYDEIALFKIRNIGAKSFNQLLQIRKLLGVEKKSQSFTKAAELPETRRQEIPAYILDGTHLTGKESISILDLPKRIENALWNGDIRTIDVLCETRPEEMLALRNLGLKSVNYLINIREDIVTKKDLTQSENKDSSSDIFERVGLSAEYPIEILKLPTRIENVLRHGNINTVSDLYNSTKTEIMSLENKSFISLDKIRDIKYGIESGILPDLNIKQALPKEKLLEYVLDRCQDKRAKNIMIRRYGITNGERETLEEIGKDFKITRERVRQIQNKTIQRMRHLSTKLRKTLIDITENIFLDNGGLINSSEADKLLPPALNNQELDGSSVLDLMSDIGWIQKHKIGDESFYCSTHTNFQLPYIMEKIVEILRKKSKLLGIDEIVNELGYVFGDGAETDVILSFVAKCCNTDPRIEKIGEKYTLYAMPNTNTKKWEYYISQVLDRAGVPMHFTEIAEKVNEQFTDESEKLEQRRVHAILIQSPLFAHTGSWGMYGLTKWGLRKESTLDLAEEYIKKAGFPVHLDQIYNYVSKYKYTKPGNISSILSNRRFIKKGKGMYWIRNEKYKHC